MKPFQGLRKHLPDQDEVHRSSALQIFGDTLKNRNLWALNRVSVSNAVGIGVFCAFLPMPFETVVAVFLAIMWRANLPVSIAVVWISNPLTWVPLYTPCYVLGTRILGLDPIPIQDIGLLTLGGHYVALWLGCLIVGTTAGLTMRFLVMAAWRVQVRSAWHERRRHRMARKALRLDKHSNPAADDGGKGP